MTSSRLTDNDMKGTRDLLSEGLSDKLVDFGFTAHVRSILHMGAETIMYPNALWGD